MYVIIKLEGDVGRIHSVNVDGEATHKFVHRSNECFGLKEAADKIINQEKEIEESNREIERKQEEMKAKRIV